MKVAIIGGGYVGRAVARLWHHNGHEVTITTTTPDKQEELARFVDRVELVEGNQIDRLTSLLQDREVVLLSVAAKQRNLESYRYSYLTTAQNIVRAIANSNVRQLIYTSSYAVLGDKQGAWTDETAPVAPANENGEILYETETTLLSASNEVKICLLRLSGIYGEGRELIKIFRSWAGTTRPGKGEDYSNWVHLDDIVNGIEFVRQKQLAGIYNLTSDEILTTGEFFARLFEKHNLPPITWDTNLASIRPYNTRLSNRKLTREGFQLLYPQIIF
jgi:nucleoside-diphosphate-sugar epimerase